MKQLFTTPSQEYQSSRILLRLRGFRLLWAVFSFVLLILVLSLGFQPYIIHAAEKGPKGTIRVGVFPFAPFNYLDEKGVAQGLNPDLLREIIRDEDWNVEFVGGSWAEGLDRLQSEDIDLMLSVAYSPERGQVMDYTYESVAELWGQVFVRPEEKSKNISDLAGKRVGIMRNDISGSNFITTAAQLDVLCKIVEFDSHGDVFAAVEEGVVDAGVAPQHFGLRHSDQYGLVASTIMFSPFSIYFASKKGTRHELLSHIDAHLSQWKRDKQSFYYQRLNHWMAFPRAPWAVPLELLYAFIITGILALFFAGLTLFFRKMVVRKTRELIEIENSYREIYNSTFEGIMILEADTGVLLDVNDTTLTMYGYGDKEALLASNLGRLSSQSPPYTAHEARKFLKKCNEEGPQVFEWLAKKQSGETFWVEVSLRKKEMNQTGKVLAVVRDITERKLAAEALLESEERFRTLTTLAPVGIYLTNPEGLCQYANPCWCVMAGLSLEEALGGGWIQGLHPDDRDGIFACWQEMTESRGHWEHEYRFLTPEGKVTWVYGLATPQLDAAGKIIRYIGINTDITERKQMEAALQASLVEKDLLLREVHHRVKNNMAAIIGLFDLQRQAMDDLHSQAILVELSSRVRAMSLVHEKLYRSESLSLIDFQDYIQSLLSHLRTSYGSPAVRCEVDAQGVALPLDLAVPCGMIINELITNALKYAFPEERLEATDEAAHLWVAMRQDHNRFTLTVADNGVGLPPGFDLNTVKTLGLSLVRMLGQHQLGGRYQVEQTRGLQFTLTFSIHNGMKTYEQRNHSHR